MLVMKALPLSLRFRADKLPHDVAILAFKLLLRGLGQHYVGHEGGVTRCDDFSLRSSLDANPQGVTLAPLQSTIIYSIIK